MTRWLPLLFLVVWTGALFSQSEPITPAANPGRPTVSTPATLTPVGYLQFETGLQLATSFADIARQLSLNQVTKLAIHPSVQLIAQFQPVVRTHGGGTIDVNAGGIAAGAQFRLLAGDGSRPTISASYFHSVYGGNAPDL